MNDSRYFYDQDRKSVIYNHASKRCAGCGQRRSVGQFQSSEFCKKCVTRGIFDPEDKTKGDRMSSSKNTTRHILEALPMEWFLVTAGEAA
jgi:hypothetical protein